MVSALQASVGSMLNIDKAYVEDNFGRLRESASLFIAMLREGLTLLGFPL
jgi:hypothetical protein